MKHRIYPALSLAALAAAGLLAGCGSFFSPKPDYSQFYLLSALPASAAPATPPEPDLAMGVFSPDIPAYLERPQIVTRSGDNQVMLNDYQRWAEPFGSGFSRVLAQDIGLLAGTSRVAVFPLTQAFEQEFETYVLVFQFDGVPGGDVTLRARWRITGPGGKPNYVVQESILHATASATGDNYKGYVAAMSALVGDLAREIVAAVPQAKTAEAAQQAAEAQAAAQTAAAEKAAADAITAKAQADRATAAQQEAAQQAAEDKAQAAASAAQAAATAAQAAVTEAQAAPAAAGNTTAAPDAAGNTTAAPATMSPAVDPAAGNTTAAPAGTPLPTTTL
jgi:hypothetical protein